MFAVFGFLHNFCLNIDLCVFCYVCLPSIICTIYVNFSGIRMMRDTVSLFCLVSFSFSTSACLVADHWKFVRLLPLVSPHYLIQLLTKYFNIFTFISFSCYFQSSSFVLKFNQLSLSLDHIYK